MKRFPKLRPTPGDGLTALLVLALALGLLAFQWRAAGSEEALTAVISVDGQEMERLPLGGAARERVYQANGYTLTVSLSPEGARVTASDCPTQDCVHTGAVTRNGQSIVCLPARFLLRLEGGPADMDGVDAVLG